MAINFPNSPSNGTQHTSAGVTWTYDGTTWKADGVTSTYSLPTAAANVKGGVKVGSGLTMTSETLSADASAITVQEEGSSLATAATTLNFVGSNVTATGTGAVKTITITDSDTQLTTEAVQDIVGAMFSGNTETNITATYEDSDGTIDLVASGGGSSAPEITWTLGANLSNNYTFTGSGFTGAVNDPTLYLIRGQTYKFDNQTGGHPFRIQSTGATVGGGTQYNSGVTNQDASGGNTLTFIVPMDAPDTLYYQCTAHPAMFGTINVITQGGSGLQSRTTGAATSSGLADAAAGNLTITAAKTYVLHKIQTSHAAWVTVYTDSTARTNDAARSESTDPLPGAGVIAEVITSDGATQPITPGTIGWNNEGTPTTNAYVKVVNKSGNTANVTVTLHFLAVEA